MAEEQKEKKYYWLKLRADFFKDDEIKIIEEMDNGKEYTLFYIKLLASSVKSNGMLRFNEAIPYNEKMLSSVTNTNIDIVRTAMKIFKELEMVEILDDETIYMRQIENMIGAECDSAERVRKYREKKKLLQCNSSVTDGND